MTEEMEIIEMKRLSIVAAMLLLAGCSAHGKVPVEAASAYTPETVRQMLTGKVFVRNRPNGRLVARLFRPSGRFDFCGIFNDGRPLSSRGTWTVGADSRGRATYQHAWNGKRSRLHVPHYDPASGKFEFRSRRDGGQWVAVSMRGWLQKSWPKSMAERCPGLAAGVPVDERQTATTLQGLRRQVPDAALKGLATPLPPPRISEAADGPKGQPKLDRGSAPRAGAGEQPSGTSALEYLRSQAGNILLASGAARVFVPGAGGRNEMWHLDGEGRYERARLVLDTDGEGLTREFPYAASGHRHPAFQLTDHLIGGAREHALPFMGEAYADRRFVFIGDGALAIVDLQGELVAGEGFDGTWRWTQGRLEVRVSGDGKAHSIGWEALAEQLGVVPALWARKG